MIPELETADLEAILAPLAGEQPTKVEFGVKLKTAKSLGLTPAG